MSIKIIFLGDIVAKIGRKAVIQILSQLKKQYSPDLILANAENIAHGMGVTEKSINQVFEAGVNLFTSGNHVFAKEGVEEILTKKDPILLRPANYPLQRPGIGEKIVKIGQNNLLVVNLLGRVFIEETVDCPFETIDNILKKYSDSDLAGIIVDFHAEATSEKNAFGWYLDGRVNAVIGTHTHIQTADEKILPNGTAYISDIGMAGAKNTVIGVDKDIIIQNFIGQEHTPFDYPESGPVIVNGCYLEIDPSTKKSTKIERISLETKI